MDGRKAALADGWCCIDEEGGEVSMLKSLLIRYTKKKYAEDFLAGTISLSSLSTYWTYADIRNYSDVIFGKGSRSELEAEISSHNMMQMDVSEGVYSDIPDDYFDQLVKESQNHIVKSARFRMEAYGYCNLSCFYRVDYADINGRAKVDEDNLAYIALQNGITVTADDIRKKTYLVDELKHTILPENHLLSPYQVHIVQLPNFEMDKFGDAVILVKNEEEFSRRIINAVKQQGGDCVIGDVIYHPISGKNILKYKHHVTLISDKCINITNIIDKNTIKMYGCLDKYDKYQAQKEWRICWLPKEHNHERKILNVGDLHDIVEIIPREQVRKRLLEIYPGYIPGYVTTKRDRNYGTISYTEFKKKVEQVDGLAKILLEVI